MSWASQTGEPGRTTEQEAPADGQTCAALWLRPLSSRNACVQLCHPYFWQGLKLTPDQRTRAAHAGRPRLPGLAGRQLQVHQVRTATLSAGRRYTASAAG